MKIHTIAFIQGKKNPATNIPVIGPAAPVTKDSDI